MDASRYKRQAAQSRGHTTKKPIGISVPVPMASSARPTFTPRIAADGLRNRMRGPVPVAAQAAPRLQPPAPVAKVAPPVITPAPAGPPRARTLPTMAVQGAMAASTAPLLPVAQAIKARMQPAPVLPPAAQPVKQATEFTKPPVFKKSPALAPTTTPIQDFASAATTVEPAQAVLPLSGGGRVVPEPDNGNTVQAQPKKVRVPAFDMDLPGEASPSLFARARSRNFRKIAFRGAAIGLVLMITTGGLVASQVFSKSNKVFQGSTETAAALKKDVAPELLKGEGAGRINVLLMGRGGGTHSAPDLTDTLMIVSVDPVNHTQTLFSVPRDLWVTVPNQGVMKLNAAWETGVFRYQGSGKTGSTDPKAIQAGFDLVDKTLTDVLGIDINYNVIVNFQAFSQAIDTVGGINVSVPADLVDPTMAWENGNDPVLAHAGPQAFDGKKALIYSRSRETSSDFARAQRQRAIMLALKAKVDSVGTLSNPLKLSGLLNAFGNNVQTDLSLNSANRLYGIMKQVTDATTTSVSLADGANPLVTTGNVNGQSIVLPKAGLFKYTAIQDYVHTQLKDPYITKENAKIRVLNGTLIPGVATTKADELKAYGYNVVGTANTPNSGWTSTILVDLTHGKDKYTSNYLQKHYGVKALTAMPDDTIPTNGADFVIIIGSNEATSTQTQAR